MPTYDYKCKNCREVFEFFRHLSEIDKEVRCPNCGSEKTQRLFSIPQIIGETVAGSGYGESKYRQANPSTGRGLGSGMGRGLGRGPRDGRGRGRGMGRGWRRNE